MNPLAPLLLSPILPLRVFNLISRLEPKLVSPLLARWLALETSRQLYVVLGNARAPESARRLIPGVGRPRRFERGACRQGLGRAVDAGSGAAPGSCGRVPTRARARHPSGHRGRPRVWSNPGPNLGPGVRSAAGCSCGGGFGPRAQLCVVMDLEYVATNGERGRCEIPGIGAMARSELERLGCDADVYGIIFDGRGLPLYHGRNTRRISPQQWRALVARDRGCVICGAAPNWCQGHHVRYWILGGRTDIDNLALVCHQHHRWIHDNRITLQWGSDGWRAPPGPDPPGLTTRRRRRALQPA